MTKLYAFEDIDENLPADLEASPEEGEAADVQLDVDQDLGEASEQSDAIVDGVDAADQMEEVEGIVEGAAEDGEGLDPVAADATRVAVEAICARVGASPKAFYSLYATENFQSASSRKANTRFALEGIREFLKDMWKRIKTALQNLWDKAKSFWEKHISSLGRIKKALESMKTKVGESSGKLKDKAYIDEAPSGLADTFAGKSDLNANAIQKFIAAHGSMLTSADQIDAKIAAFNTAASDMTTAEGLKAAIGRLKGGETVSWGTSSAPLVGGVYIVHKFEADEAEGTVDYTVERETSDEKEPKVGVSIADKGALKTLITETVGLINNTIKFRDKTVKVQEGWNKASLAIDKAINSFSEQNAEEGKNARKLLKIAYKMNAKMPTLHAEAMALNVKLAKGVLTYASLCLKNYK